MLDTKRFIHNSKFLSTITNQVEYHVGHYDNYFPLKGGLIHKGSSNHETISPISSENTRFKFSLLQYTLLRGTIFTAFLRGYSLLCVG